MCNQCINKEQKIADCFSFGRYCYRYKQNFKQIRKGKFVLVKWASMISLRKPKVFTLQILQRYLTREGRVRKFFHCSYGKEPCIGKFEGLARNFLGFRKL